MPLIRRFFLFGAAFSALAPSSAALAAMQFCNRTAAPIEAALGYRDTGDWTSQGWWRIEPDQCVRVFGKPLTQRFYFDYAISLAPPAQDQPPFAWSGKYKFCTDEKPFQIEGDSDCETRGYKTKGFQEVDIGADMRDYTLSFKNNDSK
jgi:uncharacterized membrane protein